MFRSPSSQNPLTPQERWVAGIFLAILVGLFATEIITDYQPAKLSALFLVLFWIPLLALHEAGHAVVAMLLGWHVGQVVIGVGRRIVKFRLGGAVVEIRLLPVEGFVKCVPQNLHWPRLKSACIYFAGPGVEILFAVVILLLVGPAKLFTASTEYSVIAWQSLALASIAQAVVNLVPSAVFTPDGDIANDGLGIIRSFFKPTSYFVDMIGMTYEDSEPDWEMQNPADWWKRGG